MKLYQLPKLVCIFANTNVSKLCLYLSPDHPDQILSYIGLLNIASVHPKWHCIISQKMRHFCIRSKITFEEFKYFLIIVRFC